ncbi:alpha/beta fold hydrolase [Paenibacillus glycanilyticus]|uniref:alpha/beta fold hydrolase n=1 Tax=Paenibacillus glycanilyticus TaxID=126569 RepID=UPI001F2806C1|nr:alpha/beta fold hydrolase [Paenibacillus glycanilyticus]
MTATVNETNRTNGLSFFTTGDGVRLAYRLDGAAGKPILLMANSIATSMNMWDGQMEAFKEHFRVLRYDYRGHGDSDTPAGPYSTDRMGRDVVELLDSLQIGRVHFLGLSLGGVVGQWLGIHAPERINRLILSNTSSYLGPAEQWNGLIDSVLQAENLNGFADTFINNWFPTPMIESGSEIVAAFRKMVLATRAEGIGGSWAAIRDMDLRRTAALIGSPTLVIAGQYDTVTLPSHGELLAETVPHAKLLMLPAVHLPNVEFPDLFESAVLDFLLAD